MPKALSFPVCALPRTHINNAIGSDEVEWARRAINAVGARLNLYLLRRAFGALVGVGLDGPDALHLLVAHRYKAETD